MSLALAYLLAFLALVAAFVAYHALFELDGERMTRTRLAVGLGSLAIAMVILVGLPEGNGSPGDDCQARGSYVWDC